MIKILSIGFGDKKKVKYEKENNIGITETYQLSTEDDFRPEILEPYVNARSLVFEVFKVFKLFEEEWMKIKSISLKWHKQLPRIITEVKYVLLITNKKGDECTITTSWLPVEEEIQDKLIPLVEEIERFVRGTRAQGKLFTDDIQQVPMATQRDLAEYDTDELDADDVAIFHVNDIQVKEVRQ